MPFPQKHSVLEDGEAVCDSFRTPTPFQSCGSPTRLAEKHAFGKPPRTGAELHPEVVLSDGVDSQENSLSLGDTVYLGPE